MNATGHAMRGCWSIALTVAAVLVGGCGQARWADTAPVAGHVTLEGRPIEDGDIQFGPEDPHRSPTAARIKRGRYSGRATVGRNRVSITASGTSQASPLVDGARLPVNVVPACYNDATTLTVDVVTGRENTFDFALGREPEEQR